MTEELTKGAPVRYFPGFRDGRSRLGLILITGKRTVGGTEGYYVAGAGFISASHIEPLVLGEDGCVEVATAREAFEVCDFPGITDVVITDNMERLKIQKLMKGLR